MLRQKDSLNAKESTKGGTETYVCLRHIKNKKENADVNLTR